MHKNLLKYFTVLSLCLCSASTYAAANASLWGGTSDIDKPIPPIQQIEQQQAQVQAQQQAIENERTICELIQAQPSLTTDTANAAKIKDALAQVYKTTAPDYKMFIVSSDAANDLYAKWRDLYIKTYCLTTQR